jgi:hypothetical protein
MVQDEKLGGEGYYPQSTDLTMVTLASKRSLPEDHSCPASNLNNLTAPGVWKALILDETNERDELSPNHDTAIALGLSRSGRFAPTTDWKNLNSEEDEQLPRTLAEEQNWRMFEWLMSDTSWTQLNYSRRLDIDVTRYEQYMRSIPLRGLGESRSMIHALATTNSVSDYFTALTRVSTNDTFFSVTSRTRGSKTIATHATTE